MIGISSGILAVPFILTIIAYFLLRRNKYKNKTYDMIFIDIVFFVYCYVTIGLLYFPLEIHYTSINNTSIKMNLVPLFNTIEAIKDASSPTNVMHIIIFLLGNLFIFVPLALYLAIRFPHKMKHNLYVILAVAIGAELFQFLLAIMTRNMVRIIDIDDIIYNSIGGVSTWLILKMNISRNTTKSAHPPLHTSTIF